MKTTTMRQIYGWIADRIRMAPRANWITFACVLAFVLTRPTWRAWLLLVLAAWSMKDRDREDA